MRKILLDTNGFRKFTDGDTTVKAVLEECGMVLMTPVVIGELMAGFKGGNREKVNLERLDRFLNKKGIKITSITTETSKIYAKIWFELKLKGKPVPANDIWIAAQVMELGATLVTFDKHFEEIEGLRLWR